MRIPARIQWPSPGVAPSREFYGVILDEYDARVEAGSLSPIQDLSGELGISPGTVKSWMHRGRKYLGRDSLPVNRRRHCVTCTCEGYV